MRSVRTWAFTILVGLAALPAWAAPKRVLVVHSVDAESDWVVPALTNLLGHFDSAVTTLSAQQYTAGTIDDYRAVIYLGARPEPLSRALLNDLYDSEVPVCWLGPDLDQLAYRFSLGRYGFRISGRKVECGQVNYRETLFSPISAKIAEILVNRPDLCEVLASGGTAPYAVRSGRLWYFPHMPLEGVRELGLWLVLADQLHDVLGEKHPMRRTAFLCITDINPMTRARDVRSLVKALRAERVSAALAVTPLYRDPERERESRLRDKQDLVEALGHAARDGAAIVALGLTYQSARRTGEEAEFWDEARHGPLLERSSEDTHRRIDQAINELAECRLYPVAWSTPRGLAAPADYAEIAQGFSTAWERRLPGPYAPSPQVFPFLIDRDIYGQGILPEPLPTLGQGDRADALLSQVRPLEAVRDSWVSVGITPQASVEEVRKLVSELRRAGWEFADLRRMDNWVMGTPLHIYTTANPMAIEGLIPVDWSATLFPPDGSRDRRFERGVRNHRSQSQTVAPGTVVVAYPPGLELDLIFVAGGPVRSLTHGLVLSITRTVTLFAIGACLLFLVVYLVQITMQRRRA